MKCSFCDSEIEPGTGIMFVKSDGKTMFFCSSKCERNRMKLKRNPRYTRWSGSFEKKGEGGKK